MNTLPNHILKHTNILRNNAAECAVLLKKDGNFPLESPCRIALYGSGARKTVKGGTGSGDVNCVRYNSCEQALENNGFTVTTKAWLDAYDAHRAHSHREWVEDIKEKAGKGLFVAIFGAIESEREYSIPLGGDGEACVYVLARISGEGNDRKVEKGNVLLTDTEVRDILKLNQKFEKFMLVLNVGGVVDLTPVQEVKNILLLSQLGVVTGDVLADILIGKCVPSGKLTTTWAKPSDYQTIGDFGERDDTRYKEGVYVGYRYFDSANVTPIYPFGYGLGYTEFAIEIEKITHDKGKISVAVKVRNIGKFKGKEVVQLYVSGPQKKWKKPYQSLAAFIKTQELKPNEEQAVTLSFDLADVAFYCEECASFVLEAGKYFVRVGNSSRNTTVVAVVELSENVVTEKVKNALGKPDFEDAVFDFAQEKEPSAAEIIQLSANDFTTIEHDYKIDKHINPVIESLTDEQLIHMCVGAYLPKSKLSVLGSSACHVCGASGETSNYVHDITDGKYLVLADGPAGLRISARYAVTPNGMRTVYEKLDGLLEFLPKEMQQNILMSVDVPAEQILCQDTTAIPIGTAIAQSWNPDFALLCGDIVGTECEIFKCHFWLAPAMNIHRNILCGRNFEYYSEDPVITGKIAAGIVKGLQQHKNIGATIKHFCANNQEWNRYNNNSIVSERALREIYLKGFEICVKEAAPKALMTSYNLLNGEHTSQRADLLDGILRGEWGYKGFVMSDWITTGHTFDEESKHATVYAHKIVNAGNDLVTPGGDPDYEDLEKALKEGNISREQLEICATRVYEAIMENNE
jgi:hypothetical protein